MVDCIFGHRQATCERGNERGNVWGPEAMKPPGRAAYVIVFGYKKSGCGGAQPTMSQVCFVGWSQVQGTKNWHDFSDATFSCLTLDSASKM
jgi:hypothetical protein